MMGLAVQIELANMVAVQCPHDADAREHRWPVAFCNEKQRLRAADRRVDQAGRGGPDPRRSRQGEALQLGHGVTRARRPVARGVREVQDRFQVVAMRPVSPCEIRIN
jgi:hypothetical protein